LLSVSFEQSFTDQCYVDRTGAPSCTPTRAREWTRWSSPKPSPTCSTWWPNTSSVSSSSCSLPLYLLLNPSLDPQTKKPASRTKSSKARPSMPRSTLLRSSMPRSRRSRRQIRNPSFSYPPLQKEQFAVQLERGPESDYVDSGTGRRRGEG